jgi:succinate dehydrogenase / fumarate reductase membrane anchor subunit
MVKRVLSSTALGRTGISDWLVQRVSALIMLAYVVFMLGFYLGHSTIDFDTWHGLFAATWMRIFNVLLLLSVLGHAWIGIWTVLTDYVKCAYLRGTLQVLIILGFLACLVWGIQIFWM